MLTVAVNNSAFNLGKAGGAWAGGRVLDGAAPHWLIGILAAVAARAMTAVARRSAGVGGSTDVAVV